MTRNKTDILIIGGGPAGTTIGTLLREKGWDVVLLEKEHHPRFHIGESLLPMNLPILERLDLLHEVSSIGVAKLGADFTIANSGADEETYYFADALGKSPPQAFEVRRSEFDQVLFERCKRSGVKTFEGTKVTRVTALDNESHEVESINEDAVPQLWEAKFVIDASGRDAFLSSSNGWKKRNPNHASAAIFGHFRGVKRRPDADQGNISIYWFDHGWIWMIPLKDDRMSVGIVCRPEYLKTRQHSLDEFLISTLNGIAETHERMKSAQLEMSARATGNYSYLSDRMCGPGYLMIGDAYAFIDPVFSSGVYLAMSGAEQGVAVAESWLSGDKSAYRRACRRYQKYVLKGLSSFSWFIVRFTSPAMQLLMSNPRRDSKVVRAVISMLAGDVYSSKEIRFQLLAFKAIYAASWLFQIRESIADWRRKQRSNRAADSRS